MTAIVIILIVATSAGFAFAKLRYRASGFVFLPVVAALMVPLQSIIIPEYVNLGKLGLINTYLGADPGLRRARGTLRDVPDGHVLPGHLRRPDRGRRHGRARVRPDLPADRVPLSWPAIATVTVLQFIQIWDDLLVGLLFLQNPQQRTITVGLARCRRAGPRASRC